MKKQIMTSLFITFLFAGCCIILRLSFCNGKAPLQPVHPAMAKKIKKEQAHAAGQLQQQLESFEQKSRVSQKQLAVAKEALRTARQKNKQLLQQLLIASGSLTEDSTSPAGESIQLLTASEDTKDSLCDKAIAIQEERVAQKDSVIALTNRQYRLTKANLDQSLQAQHRVQQQLKKERRKKLAWKIVTVAAGTLWLLNQ